MTTCALCCLLLVHHGMISHWVVLRGPASYPLDEYSLPASQYLEIKFSCGVGHVFMGRLCRHLHLSFSFGVARSRHGQYSFQLEER